MQQTFQLAIFIFYGNSRLLVVTMIFGAVRTSIPVIQSFLLHVPFCCSLSDGNEFVTSSMLAARIRSLLRGPEAEDGQDQSKVNKWG